MIRPATIHDAREYGRVWSDAVPSEKSASDDWEMTRPLFGHEVRTGIAMVAESDGRAQGLAVAIERHDILYLAELAVRAEVQLKGIGRSLLDAVFDGQNGSRATLSAMDYRAHALYVRAGMTPRFPVYCLRGEQIDPNHLWGKPDDLSSGTTEDIVALDASVGARLRAVDIDFYASAADAERFLVGNSKAPAAYSVVQRCQVEEPGVAGAWLIGPIGSVHATSALRDVYTTVVWAASRTSIMEMRIPGPHPALPALLDAGFKITYIETFFSAGDPFIDPARYIPGGGALF